MACDGFGGAIATREPGWLLRNIASRITQQPERDCPMFESLENRQFMSATAITPAAPRTPRPVPPVVMAGESPSQLAAIRAHPNDQFGITRETQASVVQPRPPCL